MLFVLSLLPSAASGQGPDDVVRTDVSLVQLNIGVVDPRGYAVTSLSRNDFTVFEDGVKQPILNFEPTETPFSLVLLLDTSAWMGARARQGILLDQDLDAGVLLVQAAVEQPGIGRLPSIGAGVDDLVPARARMVPQITHHP